MTISSATAVTTMLPVTDAILTVFPETVCSSPPIVTTSDFRIWFSLGVRVAEYDEHS